MSKLCFFGFGKISVDIFDSYEGPGAVGIVGCADFYQTGGFDREFGFRMKIPDSGFSAWDIVYIVYFLLWMRVLGAEVANIFMDVVVGGRVLNAVLGVFGLPAVCAFQE